MNNKFKIVVPSYNNEKWIATNIESIKEQNYSNFEVLYINDKSTDRTEELYHKYVGNDPKWTLQNNEKNMQRPHNVAPKNLAHFFNDPEEILLFVDGDDWLSNAGVLEQVNEFYNKMSKHFNLVNHMDDADIEVNISEFYYHLGQRDVETSRNIKKFD